MSSATRVVTEYRVATIYTQVWTELVGLPLFTSNDTILLELNAEGSITNPQRIDEDIEMGWRVDQTGAIKATHKYRARFDDAGNIENPYDFRLITRGLRQTNIPDLAVNGICILVDDPKLGEIAGVQKDRFWLKFEADDYDGQRDKDRLQSFPRNQVLIPPFNYRKIHLRFLIDQAQRLTRNRAAWQWIVHWAGDSIMNALTPRRVANHIVDTYLDRYGHLDVYIAATEDTKQLIDIE